MPSALILPERKYGRGDPAGRHCWRQEFSGLKIEQVKRLKDLELEISRLRKAISDLTLDKLILTKAQGKLSLFRVHNVSSFY